MKKKNLTKRMLVLAMGMVMLFSVSAFAQEEGTSAETGTQGEEQDVPAVQKELSECEITLGKTTYTYNGKACTPAVTVTDGEEKLTSGTDYTFSYENNVNAGTAQVIVSGTGYYTGSVTKTFTIKKAAQKISYTKSYNKVYGNKAFTVNAKRTAGDGALSYASSNKKVAVVNGKGKVTIKGTGRAVITVKAAETENYAAKSVKITVKVSPKKSTLKSSKCTGGMQLTVKWKKDTRASGYQIQYSTYKGFKKGVKTVTAAKGSTTAKVLKSLVPGKRYYVRVRAYKTVKVNGKSVKLYGAWSKAKRSGKIRRGNNTCVTGMKELQGNTTYYYDIDGNGKKDKIYWTEKKNHKKQIEYLSVYVNGKRIYYLKEEMGYSRGIALCNIDNKDAYVELLVDDYYEDGWMEHCAFLRYNKGKVTKLYSQGPSAHAKFKTRYGIDTSGWWIIKGNGTVIQRNIHCFSTETTGMIDVQVPLKLKKGKLVYTAKNSYTVGPYYRYNMNVFSELGNYKAGNNIEVYKKASKKSGVAFTMKKGTRFYATKLYVAKWGKNKYGRYGTRFYLKIKTTDGRTGWVYIPSVSDRSQDFTGGGEVSLPGWN